MNTFDKINDWIRNSEASVVNLMSSVAPWFAPLAPAYMSYQHMQKFLLFPYPIALAVALTVEILGLSTISTAIAFWSHNKRYKKEYKKAPVWIAVASFCAYLMIILTVNVLLEWSDSKETQIVARALLTLMSVPAAFILAVRTQHQELLSELSSARIRVSARENELYQQLLQTESDNQQKLQKVSDWRHLSDDEKRLVQAMTVQEIKDAYDISERAAYYWKSRGNGH